MTITEAADLSHEGEIEKSLIMTAVIRDIQLREEYRTELTRKCSQLTYKKIPSVCYPSSFIFLASNPPSKK